MPELYQWLEEKRKEILNKHYNQYGEGYLDAIMDIQNRIKILSTNQKTQNENFVWVVIGTRTLEVYDDFDVALERYNQVRGNSKSMDVQIHKRPVRSKIGGCSIVE